MVQFRLMTAFTTSRIGGVSSNPYNKMNPALHVGDDQKDVIKNRMLIDKCLSKNVETKWLKQTHSTISIDAASIEADMIEADASFTTHKNIACAVLTADCLPLLFSDILSHNLYDSITDTDSWRASSRPNPPDRIVEVELPRLPSMDFLGNRIVIGALL